jgi:3',5'-cyclic AMP phosphodiesterase CpdA
MLLAHISDPHLAPLPSPSWTDLAGKRLLGFLNWHRGRKRVHRAEVLDALLGDLKRHNPDHIAITGDLANISLGEEFAQARAWLERLGSPGDVTLVPGNHDLYVRGASGAAEHAWGEYMRGDAGENFPFVRRRGPIALVGVSTALATPPFMATGRLGPNQLARLDAMLARLAGERLFRVVLIHHPSAGMRARHKRLIDADAFLGVLARQGAELVLCGHDHKPLLEWLQGPSGRIAMIGVPSASAGSGGPHAAAAYNLYRIEGSPGAFRCEATARGLSDSGQFDELWRRSL